MASEVATLFDGAAWTIIGIFSFMGAGFYIDTKRQGQRDGMAAMLCVLVFLLSIARFALNFEITVR